MRDDVREWLGLLGKSALFLVGGVMAVAAVVDLRVSGWNARAALFLAAGLALLLPPLAFAFRDAVREARKGRL